MPLVLVESPTKARKLSQYLGADFTVEACMGHIRDLPKSKLGVDVEHDFKPDYTVSEEKEPVVKKLLKLAKKTDAVYLATDPDREGEAIAWHLKYLLTHGYDADGKKPTKPHELKFHRSTFHEITKEAVLAAVEKPGSLNLSLVHAQQARRVLDRIVGYYLSPVLWKKVRRGLSAGRVQSVALRLIVEREDEIEAFKPDEFWEVDVTLLAKKGEVVARVTKIQEKPYEPKKKADVTGVLADLKKAKYSITKIEQTQRKRSSLPPFTTSTLQQSAANRFGWSAKQTMRVAQDLYEEGLITYHRTDSVALSEQSIKAARAYIKQEFGDTYLPEAPRYFKTTSKNSQEAHEAVRPTDATTEQPKEQDGGKLDEKHRKLYDLVRKRFLASQMEAAIYQQTSVEIEGKGVKKYGLKTNGSTLVFDGWTKLFANKDDIILPELAEGETLKFKDVRADQRFTEPPPRYNDASLIKTMEKLGIGRPSTYASIISVILDRGYVERKERAFHTTAIGITVGKFLVKHFPKELDYQFTAEMEDDLDAIARGEKAWEKVIGVFFKPFNKNVADVTKNAEREKVPVEKTGETCPECKVGELVIRSGRFGKFISCSRFPECKHTDKYLEKVGDMRCPQCKKGDIVVKRTKTGRPFYGCSRYPECDYATWRIKTKDGEGDIKSGNTEPTKTKAGETIELKA